MGHSGRVMMRGKSRDMRRQSREVRGDGKRGGVERRQSEFVKSSGKKLRLGTFWSSSGGKTPPFTPVNKQEGSKIPDKISQMINLNNDPILKTFDVGSYFQQNKMSKNRSLKQFTKVANKTNIPEFSKTALEARKIPFKQSLKKPSRAVQKKSSFLDREKLGSQKIQKIQKIHQKVVKKTVKQEREDRRMGGTRRRSKGKRGSSQSMSRNARPNDSGWKLGMNIGNNGLKKTFSQFLTNANLNLK
jgi:hypothetical protein